ncbi:Protein of unknown function [Pyronema omphalodes CBS 100304]|uniref:Uncharacterized protein n=1 Tax=Pyronema omphalodes (strain CBS 100304) TaxID=1076935 RepID=U4LRC1_PYROM|nr:Protein of unknown function [Pyronema omphalodes CBS 100304]
MKRILQGIRVRCKHFASSKTPEDRASKEACPAVSRTKEGTCVYISLSQPRSWNGVRILGSNPGW